MKQEINWDNIYTFYSEEETRNLYTFETSNQISYEVKFKSCDYIFEGRTDFYIPTYELVIQVTINETGRKPPLDSRIPITIAAIFKDFYLQYEQQVIIYICDSSDSRQEARRRKFDQWVEVFKGTEFVKFDTKIVDPAGPIYYNSIILRSNNPYRDQIIQSFIDLADEQQK